MQYLHLFYRPDSVESLMPVVNYTIPSRIARKKFYKDFFSYILFSNQLLLQSGNHHPWRLFFFRFLFSFGLHIGFSFSESLELSSLWQSPSAVDCAVEVDTGGGGDSKVTCLDVSSCGGEQTTWIGLLNKAFILLSDSFARLILIKSRTHNHQGLPYSVIPE